VFCATELIQPDSVLIKPGEPLTITCTVSGASITDSSSHIGTVWIRHPAGKALEWISTMFYTGDIDTKDSLKSKFTFSRDTSRNTITLQGQNLQAEDTAVYYCARHTPQCCRKSAETYKNSLTPEPPFILSSSPAQLKTPGESVKLSCVVSGYSLTDYGTGWIRHPPGKSLEWIGIIWGGGSIDSGAAFKSRFKISRDTSSNVLFLDISSLQTGDTAVYYCAKTTAVQLSGSTVHKQMNICVNKSVHCEELTQPASIVVSPGQSLTIDCKVSYSVTSYWTGWIRQSAGKALEWIGEINSGGSLYYSDKLKNKFSFSRNTGTNTVTLQGQNLQTEDTAVVSEGQFGEDLQLSANSDQLQLHKHHAPHVCTAAADGRMCPLSDIISAEIRLDQSPAEVKKPGEAVKISCTVSGFTMTSAYMHWIRQKPGNALEWIGRVNSDTVSDEIQLDQSPAEVKRPGEAVKISCTISGFTMTMYYMSWIRQKPGNALEWIGYMSTGSNSATYADSMRDHFVMTEDVSTSTQFLQAKSLRAEDTAVYYCARDRTVMELMEQLVSEGQFGEDLQLSANSDQLQLHKHHAPHVCTAAADGRMCPLSGVHCEELTQPGSMVVRPGQSLTIDCKDSLERISSFLLTLISSSSTNTMLLTSVLLLLMAGCVHSQVVLTQSEGSVTVAPGGSYKLTCACSGFSLGNADIHWIRQAPGKGLEWIVYYHSDSYKSSAQSVQGRFTASKDSSNFYLHMSQLKPEDTAVYYCAKDSHSGGTHTDSCTRTRVEDKQREGDS
ncbi:hypothetical protein NFI96_024980, partial [Prochilodus magdalenae]